MLIKDEARSRSMPATAIGLVAAGAVLGAGLMIAFGGGDPGAKPLTGPLRSGNEGATPVAADLATVHISLTEADARVLQQAREAALAAGALQQSDAHIVPARVHITGVPGTPADRVLDARVRLKGDWPDHYDTDKWSLRVELRGGELLGMSRFSVQHPKTRGYLMEWLIFETARREELLAPRSRYVNVSINGRSSGVYFLEEHFTKEMLESQGRREGPIVKLREDTLWNVWLQHDYLKNAGVPTPVVYGTLPYAAEVSAFSEARMFRVESLTERLGRALRQMRDLQRAMLATKQVMPLTFEPMPLEKLEALEALKRKTVDDLIVSDKLGKVFALASVFQAVHGLSWHQYRFYHDPVLDRLEPVVFDMGAPYTTPVYTLLLTHPALHDFTRSDRCYEAGFELLGRMVEPEYFDSLFEELAEPYAGYYAALASEGLLPEDFAESTPREHLRRSCDHIRNIVRPRDAANFATRLVSVTEGDADPVEMIEVEAWSTGATPVSIEEFRFSNGRAVDATRAIEPTSRFRRQDGVVLPRRGRALRFRFRSDSRLQNLRDIEAIKRSIRELEAPDRSAGLQVDVHYRALSATEPTRERLRVRDFGAGDPGRGRPAPVPLLEALERHECLAYDLDFDLLAVRPGTWEVDGDLILPPGYSVQARPGTTLRFAPGAVLVSASPLAWSGEADEPIVLEPRDAEAGWAGLLVYDSEERSRWEHVHVRGTISIQRGGWQTTGGVTFYRAPIDLLSCRFEDARGEDSLNLFGAEFSMTQTTFEGGPSDLFDGDFVRGKIDRCHFAESGEDAVDVSGSRIEVVATRFEGHGDKALSIGEDSTATIRDCTVHRAGIGVAAKDLSDVTIDGLKLDSIEHFGLAVYIKKGEYGGSSVRATNLEIGSVGRQALLVQERCSLEVDGQSIPGVRIDVEELYRQKILGR